MSDRIADAYVLVLTEGMSLRAWADSGVLEREWAIHERMGRSYGRTYVVSFGGEGDEALAGELPGSPGVVFADRPRFSGIRSAVVRTNQMHGGRTAVSVAGCLRRSGVETRLVARGGYPVSRLFALRFGAASARAIAAAEEESLLLGASDLAIGTTEEMCESLAWRHQIDRGRFRVVPNYVIAEPVSSDRCAREVLVAGRLDPQKRVDLLLSAVGLIAADRRPVVRIVGEGVLHGGLAAQAVRLGVDARFEGRLPHAELLDRMRRCAVFAQTSGYEGHPKTVLEAQACGAAVLVTDTLGLGSVVRDGETGLVSGSDPSEIASRLDALLSDESLRDRLGATASERVLGELTVGRIAELELSVHRELRFGGGERGAAS